MFLLVKGKLISFRLNDCEWNFVTCGAFHAAPHDVFRFAKQTSQMIKRSKKK